jgi:hypothetical protein
MGWWATCGRRRSSAPTAWSTGAARPVLPPVAVRALLDARMGGYFSLWSRTSSCPKKLQLPDTNILMTSRLTPGKSGKRHLSLAVTLLCPRWARQGTSSLGKGHQNLEPTSSQRDGCQRAKEDERTHRYRSRVPRLGQDPHCADVACPERERGERSARCRMPAEPAERGSGARGELYVFPELSMSAVTVTERLLGNRK